MNIGGATRVFAILGDPVSHSLSPTMQNAAFRALGLDAVYVPLRCEAEALAAVMHSLVRQGGGGNVTIPHKEAAAAVVSGHGAYDAPVCNTFWAEAGNMLGAETDSLGIEAVLRRLQAPPGPWCLIGTGGSARAALRAAQRAKVSVAVTSRTPGRAGQFQNEIASSGIPAAPLEACRVIINCTPLGLADADPDPIPPGEVPAAALALDLVYRRGETAWVHSMRKRGCVAVDGREVLVEQGAAAFERWFPKRTAPREIMRSAVRAALA
jgi:shikimate dehydrogenase